MRMNVTNRDHVHIWKFVPTLLEVMNVGVKMATQKSEIRVQVLR